MNPITLADIYDAYPDNDILPVDPVTDTLKDIDFGMGDSMFVLLCREILEDEVSYAEAMQRLDCLIADCSAVRAGLIFKYGEPN